jgi:hypothetical protein
MDPATSHWPALPGVGEPPNLCICAKGRRKTAAKHWWKTRADPFAESWPLVESWLVAEPNITAKELMVRLTNQLSDLYPTSAQLRTLQRRVKAWRAHWARQLVFAASSARRADLSSGSIP